MAAEEFAEDSFCSISVPWSNVSPFVNPDQTIRLEIRVSYSFIPVRLNQGQDQRDLALRIKSIKFEP